MFKLLTLFALLSIYSNSVLAHAGAHGNDECLIEVGEIELRLNGYQFQGRNPDRHYCRHFPYLGQTILKFDSISADLSDKAVELQLLKLNSWLGLILNNDQAFSVIKELPLSYFSKQVVSISEEITSIDVYALNIKLYGANGFIAEQQFMFMVGLPFAQVMVGIAVVLLLFLILIVIRNWLSKRQQH